MFQFVYACLPNETVDPGDLDGFVGVENAAGERITTIGWHVGAQLTGLPDDVAYLIASPPARSPATLGIALRGLAEQVRRPTVLFENTADVTGAFQLWTVLEAAHHPRVRVALNVDAVRTAGQTAAVLVPTLNLRIGLLRVRTPGDDLTDYARRLAGIGFEGHIVCDPPPGPDRLAAAKALETTFRGVYPTKPAKKAVPPKPAKA